MTNVTRKFELRNTLFKDNRTFTNGDEEATAMNKDP